MCTAVAWKNEDCYFGRNMDIEYSFGEKLVVVPRNFSLNFRKIPKIVSHFAFMGMACVIENYPLFAEAVNEKGLCIAGLNFPNFAVYYQEQTKKNNITPFELIPYILAKCENISQVKNLLGEINILNESFSQNLPLAPLHWMITHENRSIVLECTQKGMCIFENPTGVMANNPTFDFHLMNLSNYLGISSNSPEKSFSKEMDIKLIGEGQGGLGLPGDFSSCSRFIKAFFIKTNSNCPKDENSSVSQFFHILDSVAMVNGSVVTNSKKDDITTYSCCINASKRIYYYKSYFNNQITGLKLANQNVLGDKLQIHELIVNQQLNFVEAY